MIPDLRTPRVRAAALARAAVVPVVAAAALVAGCNKVPLTAPTNATIRLTTNTAVVPLNGTAQVTATVIQGGGIAVHNGTLVSFTTSLGTIEPAEAETRDGRVTVTFRAGTQSGTAVVNAYSGGASTTSTTTGGTGGTTGGTGTTATGGGVTFLVGAAAAALVTAAASPGTVPGTGGTSTITASVFDANHNLLPGVPVSFSTDVGTITPSLATTDANGQASASLSTYQTSTVTVTLAAGGGGTGGTGGTTTGGSTATVKVTATVAPTVVITAPSTSPNAGQSTTFTVNITPGGGTGAGGGGGAAITKATINFGDGSPVFNLGAASGTITVSHIYEDDGTFAVTVTVADAAGQTTTASVPVTIFPAVPFTLTVTASSGKVGTPITATAIPGNGAPSVVSYEWNFGDGTPNVITTIGTVSHIYTSIPAGFTTFPFVITVTAVGSDGRTGIGSTSTTISQ